MVKGDDKILDQVKKQLNKFIDVIKVTDLSTVPSVHREIILIKVKAPPSKRQEVFQTAEVFKGKVVDLSHETITLEVTGIAEKIEALISILKPYGILEMARTGRVSISRGTGRKGGVFNG